MKNGILSISAIALCFFNSLSAQVAPSLQWQLCMGGISDELANCVLQTTDGGFIYSGMAASGDGDVVGNHSLYHGDAWIVKLDVAGNVEWKKCFGSTGDEWAMSIQQTPDSGFIVAGQAQTNDGDVSGNHGGLDYWVIKLDFNGNLIWQKCLGGSNIDQAWSIDQTSDGGFIVAGLSGSNDGDVTNHHGCYYYDNGCLDYWIVKLDSVGNLVWERSLGGTGEDEAFCIQQTTDEGYIIAGTSNSIDGDVTGNHGIKDYWIVKLDSSGTLMWEKSLGGSDIEGNYGTDYKAFIQQSDDGGYILAGQSKSNDGDVSGNHGDFDEWIVKLDGNGNIIWQKCFGGSMVDAAHSVQQTADGGFIIAGASNSTNGEVTGNHGEADCWILKVDSSGSIVWEKSFGGSDYDEARSIYQSSDSGFIAVGLTASNDGDVSGLHGGYFGDCWIIKLSSDMPTGDISPSANFISLSPNPVQNLLTVVLPFFFNVGIRTTTDVTEITIRMYDVQGRIITLPASGFQQQASSIQLNTEKLPDGFYTLQILISKSGESMVGNFVKQD
ncbi:MAG TPA: T9SS type A sorting domain-containing protein [Chitinophagales bacterium]|nr:T9SS type A sorting domain-containing protein [Chitinophagales bacterium]